jgi:hypothetical protein
MSKSDNLKTEQAVGNEVSRFLYGVPRKNHDAMVQLNKQFIEIMRKYWSHTFNFPDKQYG